MTAPTPDELLVLNSLIYSNTMDDGQGGSVYDWAAKYRNPAEINELFGDNEKIAEMSRQDFRELIDKVTSNEAVYDRMSIVDVTTESASPHSSDKHDERTNMTIDYDGQPIIVFKGTAGEMEWRTNGEGGYYNVTDTEAQQDSLDYFNEHMALFPPGSQAYVTGHSNGGNKAQYVTVLAGDRVASCMSFDGQGFNQATLVKYADLVALYGGKITSVSYTFDYVNALFSPVPGSTQMFVGGGVPKSLDPRFWHSPFAIFGRGEDGRPTLTLSSASGSPSTLIGSIDGFLAFAQKFMSKEDFQFFCYLAMSAFIDNPEEYGEYFGDPPGGWPAFTKRALSLLKNYCEINGLDPAEVLSTMTVLFGPRSGLLVAEVYATIPPTPYTTVPREFTQAVKEQLLKLVEDTTPDGFWEGVADFFGDQGSHIKQLLGGVDFTADKVQREQYYREVIDMNNVSAAKIEEIFDNVASECASFANTMAHYQHVADSARFKLSMLLSRFMLTY